jgi:hypothetical protein
MLKHFPKHWLAKKMEFLIIKGLAASPIAANFSAAYLARGKERERDF